MVGRERRGKIKRDMLGSRHGRGIKEVRRLAGKVRVESWHEFMPESDEFLNPLEEKGPSLLNGCLLHQSFVRILDIENDELP